MTHCHVTDKIGLLVNTKLSNHSLGLSSPINETESLKQLWFFVKVKSKVKNLTLIFKFWLKSKKCRKSVKILRFRIRLLRKTEGKILIISTVRVLDWVITQSTEYSQSFWLTIRDSISTYYYYTYIVQSVLINSSKKWLLPIKIL